MALDKESLKNRIITELEARGFVTSGKFAQSGNMAEAIANAVVDEITQNAQVNIESGSSAGSYKVS